MIILLLLLIIIIFNNNNNNINNNLINYDQTAFRLHTEISDIFLKAT